MFSLFRRKPAVPAAEPTFKQRVTAFWSWYATVADRFYQTIEDKKCADLTDEIGAGIDKHLSHFAWVFGPGAGGSGHSLTLTAEGNSHRQFLTQYWQSCAPTLSGWTFYAARQPGKIDGMRLSMGKHDFNPLEFWLTPYVDKQEEKIDLTVWHPRFEAMPEKQRWTVLFLFLDEVLGEYGTQQWIGEIKLNNHQLAGSMPMTELLSFVQQQQTQLGWTSLPPGEATTGYSVKASERTFPRSDVFVGSSMHFTLVREFGGAAGNLPDPLAGTGADFIYVSIPAAHFPRGEEVAVRGAIEDALDATLRDARSGRLLGGAMGRENAYIDLLVFDGEASIAVVRKILRQQQVPSGTSVRYFAKENASRVITL